MIRVWSKRLCLLNRRFFSGRQQSLIRSHLERLDPRVISGGKERSLLYFQCLRHITTGRVLSGEVVSFKLPDVGEGIQTVEIKEWLVKPGDKVSHGDEVCEVQSDKSAATIHIPYDGIIKELLYKVDDIATKGKPLLTIEVDGEEGSGEVTTQTEDAPPASPPSAAAVDILATPAVRKMAAEKNLNLQNIKGTGKDGRILKEDILDYMERGEVGESPDGGSKVLATPAVRGMAKEQGVDLKDVVGTGEGGRVLKEDLLRHVGERAPKVAPPVTPSQPTPLTPSPPTPALTQDRQEPIKGYQAVMVRTMTESGKIPQFGYCDEFDMSELVNLRSSVKDQLLEKGIKFTYMPIIIKAVSLSLKQYPILNAHVNKDCSMMTYKADHNIGVAMDTPRGLVVPNVKQVQNKTVFEIAMELNRLQEEGLKGYVPPADIVGGTFSLSNIGIIGGTYTRPILLPPEVAIGAFGKIQVLPRFDPLGQVKPVHIMQVSWSADHRVIEGATIARFSNLCKSYLENPSSMLMDLQ